MMCHHKANGRRLSPQLKRKTSSIVQDSLVNACRYSQSKRLFAELHVVGNALRIKIRDWETAFDSDDAPLAHFGREGSRQRIKLLHGVATIQREPGKGTSVTVELPFASDEANRRASLCWSD